MAELDRRDFLKLVSVSAGGAAAAGCSDHVEKLIPYVVQPEEIIPGKAIQYASTCLECPAACGLHVRTREGRPIKLEGNPEHPVNRGALCALGQASIGRTYHPDRYAKPRLRGAGGAYEEIGWDKATALLAEKLGAAGGRVRALTGELGPTLGSLFDRFLAAAGSSGGRLHYEPFGYEALREASRAVFGAGVRPIFDLEGADFVIDFGADSLETWLSPVEHARQIESAREVTSAEGREARLIYVGPRLSMTAGNADEWLPAKPGSEGILALAIARVAFDAVRSAGRPVGGDPGLLEGILAGFDAESVASRSGVPAETILRIGRAIAQAKRPAALPPGVALTSRRATATTAAVLILDAVVGAIGTTVLLPAEAAAAPEPASFREILKLVDAMASGQVAVLMLGGVNPVHSLPPGAGFADALAKVDFVVSFASLPDETSERAHLILPDHTPLESWGDAAPQPGVRSLVQPSVRPLFDTQALGDSLLQVGRAMGDSVAAQLPAGSFRSLVEAAWSGTDFRAALIRGGVFEAAPRGGALPVAASAARIEFKLPQFEEAGPYLVLPVPSPLLHDGRGANLSWLQETPDPVTKVAWQSWAEISHETAKALGVERGDVVAVETGFGRLELPALPRGGIRDEVIAIAIGQGHTVGHYASHDAEGRAGEARGVNVIALLPPLTDESGGRAWLTARAKVTATGAHARIAQLQFTDNQRKRQLAESVSLAALAAGDGAAHGEAHGGEHGSHEIRRPYDPVNDAVPESPYRWGMAIDLDRCTGCSACVVACSIENNVPQVGEEWVLRGRQMPWIRIERYLGDGEADLENGRRRPEDREKLGDVDVRHSPMMCQHCGAAPCEPVCPVLATYHTPEGLNGMIYNRCIGTRYCSNNCPYKVRRFNFFDYQIESWPEPMRLMLNPDVTVRGQGVMEKCTYCVQRIETARQDAKNAGHPIADGAITPACVQTCPTHALQFGNLKDPQSGVNQRIEGNPKRAYHALHVLNTRPGSTYLAKVSRGAEPEEGGHS
ncbi:MAG TPA: 4Fe-4S dicluster domain-containing protein [Myxococcota bacterium]|jgi:molybdopterin-containing oxidoreductase family iron-sulfur binding subunit